MNCEITTKTTLLAEIKILSDKRTVRFGTSIFHIPFKIVVGSYHTVNFFRNDDILVTDVLTFIEID